MLLTSTKIKSIESILEVLLYFIILSTVKTILFCNTENNLNQQLNLGTMSKERKTSRRSKEPKAVDTSGATSKQNTANRKTEEEIKVENVRAGKYNKITNPYSSYCFIAYLTRDLDLLNFETKTR